MKKVVFFTLSLMRGGAEGVVARLCNEYLFHQYEVTIVTCMNRPIEYPMQERVSVVSLDAPDTVYKNMGERFLKRRRRLCEVLRNIQPDLLVSFLPEPNYLALSLKDRLHIPTIISIRNDPQREYRNHLYYILMRYLYPKADGYVFQTEQAREYFSFSRHMIESSVIIPNALGNAFLNLKKADRRERKIVHAGRLEPQKNQSLLIRVFASVLKEFPDYELEIYGTGKLKDDLETQIRELGLEGKAHLYGNVGDLKQRIENAAVFVLSSDYEGIPNALMEAMAMGIPVVATDCPCGGPGFLIEDGKNGRLVPLGDENAMEQAVKDILFYPEEAEKMAEHAIERMKELYPDQIYRKWDLYMTNFI